MYQINSVMLKPNSSLCFSLIFILHFSWAQIPEYYSNINFEQHGVSLRLQLSNLITDTHHNFLPYTSGATDTWDVMRISDLSSDNSGAVLLIYGYDDDDDDFINDRSRDPYDTCHTGWCNGKWNREHVFARSLSNPPLTTTDPGPGTDIHNLRAADSQKNSERSNRFFADGSGNSGIIEGGLYYPGDEWKGDVARIIMYMYLRYPGQCNAVNSAAGPITYAIQNDMPDVLLEWNQEDPVSDFELTRNDVIYYYQGNRNPFIDNPYLASLIWNGPQAVDAWETLSGPDYDAQPVTVYPNVTDDYITISGLGSKEFKTTIYNQLGQRVFNNNNQKSINVSKLPAGVYILEVNCSQQLSPLKFIKN